MTHKHHTHVRPLALGVVFTALALVFTSQVSALESAAHGLRLQADAVEIRPPALPGKATLHQAAAKKRKVMRSKMRAERRHNNRTQP